MDKFKFIFLLFLLGLTCKIYAVESTNWDQGQVLSAYESLGHDQKIKLHRNLLKALEVQSKLTDYEQKKIEVYLSYNTLPFLGALLNRAYAVEDDGTTYCHFGGWMTSIENGECKAPWSRSVRNNPEFEIFGESYSNSCGGKNLFRCNPLIFGGGDDGKGMCTTTDDSDPNLSTTSCIEDFNKNPNAANEIIDELIDNPEKLSAYLAIAVETMRECEVQSTPLSYCDELNEMLTDTASRAVQCTDQEALISFLPEIVTPFNEDEINAITNGLGAEAIQYALELEERQEEARSFNKGILQDAILGVKDTPKMRDTIMRIRDNSSRCLRGLCNGTRYSSSKPATKSIAKCAAYVKHAIFAYPSSRGERYANFSQYPWGRDTDDAVEGGSWLEERGFVNIWDYPEMSDITPENAPPGAVIVYEKINSRRNALVDGQRRGAPGHIEIKASENEYISDFINDEPTRVGGLRRPIGIYYPISEATKDQLREIPE